jgi:signal transduction histidine kinase
MRQKKDCLSMLNYSFKSLKNIQSIKEGIRVITNSSIKLNNAEKGTFQLFDNKINLLKIVYNKGFNKKSITTYNKLTSSCNCYYSVSFEKKKSILINDLTNNKTCSCYYDSFSSEKISSILSTPLFDINDLPFGIITIYSEHANFFDTDSLKKMELYARYSESFIYKTFNKEEIQENINTINNKVKERTSKLTSNLKKANELSEMKSHFTSFVSHEFRTPLSTILSSNYLIQLYDKTEQQEDRLKHLKRIESCVNNLNDILDDFLSLDKIENKKYILEKDSFDLPFYINKIIDEVAILCKNEQQIYFDHKGINTIRIDKKIFRNIIYNLISNAIKYSIDNITVKTQVTKKEIILKVIDSGIGIPEEEKNKVFNKFFRANNSISEKGSGLGLYIVKLYIQLLGGKITFNSELNSGTTFYVTIPNH